MHLQDTYRLWICFSVRELIQTNQPVGLRGNHLTRSRSSNLSSLAIARTTVVMSSGVFSLPAKTRPELAMSLHRLPSESFFLLLYACRGALSSGTIKASLCGGGHGKPSAVLPHQRNNCTAALRSLSCLEIKSVYLSKSRITFIFQEFFFPEYGCSRSGRLNLEEPVNTVLGCVNSRNPHIP